MSGIRVANDESLSISRESVERSWSLVLPTTRDDDVDRVPSLLPQPSMDDLTTRKVLSVVSHASIFINATVLAIAIPIMILMLSNDPIVQGNSKEALNFHINLLIGYAIVALLFISIIGILLPLYWVAF